MEWTPIGKEGLATLINDAIAVMEPRALSLWSLIRVQPLKWNLPPWGDQGGGFWVVGVLGERVVWFNDIEWGFNSSRYGSWGTIADYRCNQDELQHTLHALLCRLDDGELPSWFGPPEPLHSDV